MPGDPTPVISPAANPALPRRRRSGWTIACWSVLVIGSLLTVAAYQFAYAHRAPGEWLPGMAQLLIGTFATGFFTFVCGLVAILRREPRWWVALLPFMAGAASTIYLTWCLVLRR